jgi:hypothetical protein
MYSKRREEEKKEKGQGGSKTNYRMEPTKILVGSDIEQELTQLRNADRFSIILLFWRPRYGRVEQSINISEADDLRIFKSIDIIWWFLAWRGPQWLRKSLPCS